LFLLFEGELMGRLSLAFQMFFAALGGSISVESGRRLLQGGDTGTDRQTKPAPAPPKEPPAPQRSDAITLLAALQREARFVDLVLEPLGQYSDEQVGAAARGVLSDCASSLQRIFDLKPLVDDDENAEVQTPDQFDVACYRLTGNVTGEPPFRGRLMHHGWVTSKCDLPTWSGGESASKVVAPAEIEI